ncbi:MAG: YgiQ family radical SAM protein [Candidatus Cloacimonetes bacterium]|nr:YgiQ family radical SAM protein [Candidatus Cloacimonadota bacterium]
MKQFLPVSRHEIETLGWKQADIIIISGDAYVDHPSFAAAVIGRWLQACGYKVAILPQPDINDPYSFMSLGAPRLFFGITSGNMDSMINKYTAQKKLRSLDAYSPDGRTDLRPDRATLVYSQIVHSLYKDIPIVLGGIEASMRRLPHYDYWSDKLRNSILFDSRAQLLVYGMGESAIKVIADALNDNPALIPQDVPGTAVIISKCPQDAIVLPSFQADFSAEDLFKQHLLYEKHYRQHTICQSFAGRWLKINPPAPPLKPQILDEIYALPFARQPHPMYDGKTITAFDQIKTSVTTHRGCFGGCNFCGIGYHQGKSIQSRSVSSILNEIRTITRQDYFRGTISDLGGPSANMWEMACKIGISATCPRTSCLFPEICPNLRTDHAPLLSLLKKAAAIPEIEHLFVASGIRFDLALCDDKYIRQIATEHTGGLLKLAPEHKSPEILQLMQKPSFELYQKFLQIFAAYSRQANKKQAVVPYIIVGHPGAILNHTIELAAHLKRENVKLRQIQEYIPLPMTASALMYYTGKDLSGNPIHIPKGRELRLMKALIQWFLPENRKLVIEALNNAHHSELIKFFLYNK